MAGKNGRTNPQAPGSKHRIESREMAQKALGYRRARMSYADIAKLVGYAHSSSAQRAVLRELEQQPGDDIPAVRKMETERLDALLLALWKKALNGDGWSVDRVLRIMERRSRLWGLDEPMKQQIEVITETVLDQEIARMTAALAEREAAIPHAEGNPAQG
jgi:hypothetical protein